MNEVLSHAACSLMYNTYDLYEIIRLAEPSRIVYILMVRTTSDAQSPSVVPCPVRSQSRGAFPRLRRRCLRTRCLSPRVRRVAGAGGGRRRKPCGTRTGRGGWPGFAPACVVQICVIYHDPSQVGSEETPFALGPFGSQEHGRSMTKQGP